MAEFVTSGISINPFRSCVVEMGEENTTSIPFSGCSMRLADRKRKLFRAGISIFTFCFQLIPMELPSAAIAN